MMDFLQGTVSHMPMDLLLLQPTLSGAGGWIRTSDRRRIRSEL